MKIFHPKCSIVVLLLLVALTAQAQNRASFRYKLKQTRITSAGWTIEWNGKDPKQYEVPPNTTLKALLGAPGDQVPIDVWTFDDSHGLKGGKNYIDGTTPANTKDGKLVLQHPDRATLSAPIKPLCLGYEGWVFGASAVAARVRFAFDSIPETGVGGLSFAFYAGRIWGDAIITPRRITHFGVTAAPFLGMSTTELRKNVYKDPAEWTADRTALTLTYGGHVILSRNVLGLVLSYGWESAIGPKSSQWVFGGKPWFGVGISSGLGTF